MRVLWPSPSGPYPMNVKLQKAAKSTLKIVLLLLRIML
jgi:hypothetical protein